MASQLERDITNRIHDKLFLWVKDSISLCEMAELPVAEAMANVISELCKCLVTGARTAGITKHQMLVIINDMWNEVDERKGHVNSTEDRGKQRTDTE